MEDYSKYDTEKLQSKIKKAKVWIALYYLWIAALVVDCLVRGNYLILIYFALGACLRYSLVSHSARLELLKCILLIKKLNTER